MTTHRVLVTGASGLLGRAILKEFKASSSWEALGLAFSRARADLKKVDLTDRKAVNDVVNEFKPDVIIHSAAERSVDVIEKDPEGTKRINLDATQFLCEAADAINAWVLFISTDYVFDGKNPPYKVTDEPNPLNLYGKGKVEGEKLTLKVNSGYGVLRVPVLYGEIEKLSESAVTVLFSKVKDTSTKSLIDAKQQRFPTLVDDIAYVIRELSEKKLQDPEIKGIFHWSNNEVYTKYDMAVTMAKAFGISTEHIAPDMSSSSTANRPDNSQLDCSRIENLGINKRTKFSEAIVDVLKPYL
ncbi:methionine adenosyltransferase 2 subunit beta-like isoform X2 [Ruditapes philippinarum]|nr:methionine adenosyltransferase 2 subunit beta-like isoform X2 [Ruditapes philippinarum]XP_060575006.1 methionine adenosyltransferase 2 subunit beta-like isoform X2 [Ruditapes philippinarum]XP_060575007.1 methionine adenosyltransferase 2 subunit beta-like isoform X2 [Ruditapes philippinarum]XP_060575008.1 methionine adenosyltransferase 2 subunit beta-like isoform X2 [Ruditapes philippinarum]